jgi:hypothetical protein
MDAYRIVSRRILRKLRALNEPENDGLLEPDERRPDRRKRQRLNNHKVIRHFWALLEAKNRFRRAVLG